MASVFELIDSLRKLVKMGVTHWDKHVRVVVKVQDMKNNLKAPE